MGGPLSVVKVCTSMLCKNRVSVSGPLSVEGFLTFYEIMLFLDNYCRSFI